MRKSFFIYCIVYTITQGIHMCKANTCETTDQLKIANKTVYIELNIQTLEFLMVRYSSLYLFRSNKVWHILYPKIAEN